MYSLEIYKGAKTRHTCPGCNQKRAFVRYVNDETGEYLRDDVGRCNREAKCGYHYPPKAYFVDNPDCKASAARSRPRRKKEPAAVMPEVPQSFHSRKLMEGTLGQHNRNPFLRFLFGLFVDDPEGVRAAADRYYVGLFDGLTCFWQIDLKGRIRKGKLMRYNPATGKRQDVYSWIDKETGDPIEIPTYWVHKALQKRGQLPEEVNFQNCFFGEHLLRTERDKSVAIVEAEKTAIICSMCFPEFVWIAVGAQSHLSSQKLQVLKNRSVILYPDGDAFEIWRQKAVEMQRMGIATKISREIEEKATPEQRAEGWDLADYLIAEQRRINKHNAFVKAYEERHAGPAAVPLNAGPFVVPAAAENARSIVEGAY